MNQRTEMGRRRGKESKSYTLPSSPSHSFSSSSSSDFEFTISISPRKSSTALCPADELFYKGQLLPLHLSQRISMVRTLLLSSASTSSASTAARDSTGSSSNDSHSSFTSDLALFPDCDSSRPSSVTEEDEFKRLNNNSTGNSNSNNQPCSTIKKSHKFFFSRFSSVFRKENNNLQAKTRDLDTASANSSVKRISVTAREVIRKYFKKVKPLYEKLSQKQQRSGQLNATEGASAVTMTSVFSLLSKTERSTKLSEGTKTGRKESVSALSHSFSGNLRYPRRRSCVSSCPSSMRSSPNHSGVLSQRGAAAAMYCGDTSSMEELQSAIQGAIAHCKNSLIQSKTMISPNSRIYPLIIRGVL
ncbi:probable membrane-associated kinase regulator 1 isoform X1 [Vigna unguiculata]|uniref:probable membrane-associated kinase regulator 1 isoform X1 n=2 Tax=Vigna unguiculata TaxID=3917 RepID=UPI001016750F|nr:probable membrane-associated kinase regulator 1 isoform X1 [Vigna unguiculata]